MTKTLSGLNNSLTKVPIPLSPARAGFIQPYAGTTAPAGWAGLSQTVDTTISNAENLYPNLWTNANAAWQSGSDLVVPPYHLGLRNSNPVSNTSFFSVVNFGTPSIDSTIWWRDGNRLRAILSVSTTGAQSGAPYIELPSGLNVDQTLILTSRDTLGTYYRVFSGGVSLAIVGDGNTGVMFWDGTNDDRLFFSGYSISSAWEKNQPLGAGDEVTIEVNVPIAEWATESVEIPIIKLHDDLTTGVSIGINEATEADLGLVRSNSIIFKSTDITYNSNTTGLLILTQVPQGTYKVAIGHHYAYAPNVDCEAFIRPQLNGVDLSIPGTSSPWDIGIDDDGSTSYEIWTKGYSSTLIIDFPNATNTFELDITATGGGILSRPWYILEKLENTVEITTEWD